MRRIVLLVLILTPFLGHGQPYWGKLQGGANVDETTATFVDGSNQTYTTGYFSTSAAINGTNLSVSGLTDVFLTKTNAAGASVWSIGFGSSSSDRGLDVAVDGSGSIYVCGFFSNTINFGSGISLSSNSNSRDAFVAKFDGDGNILWARSGGSSGTNDRANAIALGANGSVVISGQYSGEASFDGQSISSLGNSIDAFIAKYNSNGDLDWVRSGGGSETDVALGVTIDNSGGIYACGQFSGDITWENSYSNTIENACFIVKYSNSGSEEWFRWGGGSSQSIAYDIATNGTNVYAVGDFGEAITFFGAASNPVLTSPESFAVFIVSYSPSGAYLWGAQEHSASPVSGRAIDHRNGQLGVVGWYECTFKSLSENYGESAFNSIGFKDAYVMRHTTSGSFIWARNFGSNSSEEAFDLAIYSTGEEVIVGSFSDRLFIPLDLNLTADGLFNTSVSENGNTSYCGDSNYTDFKWLDGNTSLDGFTIRAIDLSRQPFDYYARFGSGCDLGIPDVCILDNSTSDVITPCPDSLINCAPYGVFAEDYLISNDQLAPGLIYSWSTGSSSNGTTIASPSNVSVTVTTQDGCYSRTASVFADILPPAEDPLISDNLGINNESSSPSSIEVCPGELVVLTGSVPDGQSLIWSGPNVSEDEQDDLTIVVDETGNYTIFTENEFGCTNTTTIFVEFIEVAPLIDPFIIFNNAENDTVKVCNNASATLWDAFADNSVIGSFYDFSWDISPSGNVGGLTNLTLIVDESGWYTISGTIVTEPNDCFDQIEYTVEDSVYIELLPNPVVSLSVTGPQQACANDSLMIYLNYVGDLSLSFTPIEDFGDSILVGGTGSYGFSVSLTNEFGCTASQSTNLNITNVQSPSIFSNPSPAVICPGDSVLLLSSAPGEIEWQGPGLEGESGSDIYVDTPGDYFAEVTFYEGCALVSNTLEVVEYATPFIASSNEFICEGDSVVIEIITSAGSGISWQDPFSGSDSIQVVFDAGTYTALVTGCGITTEVSFTVDVNETEVFIEALVPDPLCEGDSALVTATPGFQSYEWLPEGNNSDSVYVFQSGNYFVTALDTNNCFIESTSIPIVFTNSPELPVFEFDLVCEGETQIVVVTNDADVFYIDEEGNILQNSSEAIISPFIADTTLIAYIVQDFCEGPPAQIEIGPKPFPDPPIPASDAPVCTGEILTLEVLNGDGNSTYVWELPNGLILQGETRAIIAEDISYQGIYMCHANLDGCRSDTLSIPIELFETRQVILPPDVERCLSNDLIISPDTLYATYLWQDNSTDSIFLPQESGLITLQVTDGNGCTSFDEMLIGVVDCNVDLMNVFTPNNDGLNDTWFAGIESPRRFLLKIYNRWGTLIFESDNVNQGWDGRNQNTGRECSEGAYAYILELINFEGSFQNYHGMITLYRD